MNEIFSDALNFPLKVSDYAAASISYVLKFRKTV